MDGALEDRPKSVAVLYLAEHHRAAYEYDWRTRFHLPLTTILDGSIPWETVWDLTSQLLDDPTSRCTQALNEWRIVTSEELAMAMGISALASVLGVKGFKWPSWERTHEPDRVPITDPDRIRNMARLAAL